MYIYYLIKFCCADSTSGLKSITVNKRKLNNKHAQITQVLGSKDLGFYVFRILMCIVGKPWSKQICLVMFRLSQSCLIYVKLE